MNIYDYTTSGGKNLIMEYVEDLPAPSKAEILAVRQLIREKGVHAFSLLVTRQLYKKLWEIKISQERVMYVIQNQESVFFLNICKKQKGKAEKQELKKAIKRAKLKDFSDRRIKMAFIKADLDKELEKLNELVNDNEDAKKAYEAFQKRIALQEQLIQIRKAENMTQTDVANAAGLSQQAVSRIEKGSGATINSLIKYLTGIGYCIQFKKI